MIRQRLQIMLIAIVMLSACERKYYRNVDKGGYKPIIGYDYNKKPRRR